MSDHPLNFSKNSDMYAAIIIVLDSVARWVFAGGHSLILAALSDYMIYSVGCSLISFQSSKKSWIIFNAVIITRPSQQVAQC